MSYEMKKALRRSVGAKSYAQMQQQADGQKPDEKYNQKQGSRQSIFEHKNWSFKQKIKLMIFLSHYHGLPDWHSERRSIHLYKQLSNFLKKTRTPEQCKNIHSLFKRKFNSLVEVVEALQRELQNQENYDRLTAKYQRQIDKFQKEYGLLDGIGENISSIQPIIKPRKILQRDERQQPKLKIRVKQNDESQNQKIRLGDNIKYEYIPPEYPQTHQKPTNRWALECQHYFTEWLKCVSIIEYKNRQQQTA